MCFLGVATRTAILSEITSELDIIALLMASPPLDAIMQRTESLINAARENACRARELREMCQSLRAENLDYREFLLEQRLRALANYDVLTDQRTAAG